MQAVIMAGGKGTRLQLITKDAIPKPMASVCGKPILEWQIESLRDNGVDNVVIVTGHLGEKIQDYFGNGAKFGVQISYFAETVALGTAGALAFLEERIIDEDFFLVFGDTIFDIDIKRMMSFHKEKSAMATLFVHPNSHPFDSDLVILDEEDRVVGIDGKNNIRDYWYDNTVNAGLYILNREICNLVEKDKKSDLEKNLLIPLSQERRTIYGYSSPEYIKDVGTPERIEDAQREIIAGVVTARNLKRPQKCIFLDRDGTVNKHNGLVYKEEDLILEDCASEAIKNINESGYLAIIVTNQPVVARGLCDIHDVENIHKKLKTLLGKTGAYLTDIVFCPHHPDKGYPEENPIYKVDCECRKPKTGMIDYCIKKYNILRSSSWMIGDTSGDIQTGKNAGLKTALVMTGEMGKDGKFDVKADIICDDLLEAVKNIINLKEK